MRYAYKYDMILQQIVKMKGNNELFSGFFEIRG